MSLASWDPWFYEITTSKYKYINIPVHTFLGGRLSHHIRLLSEVFIPSRVSRITENQQNYMLDKIYTHA